MIGERGGVTDSFEDGVGLIDLWKGDLKVAIRADILQWLENHSEWHANNLRVDPGDNSNVVGAAVNGLLRSGRIVSTGERRRSTNPARHGGKSDVYKLAGKVQTSPVRSRAGGVFSPPAGPDLRREGAERDRGEGAELTGGSSLPVERAGGGGLQTKSGTSQVGPPATGQLFEMPIDRVGRSHYEEECDG